MEALDLLKKDWKNSAENFPRISEQEIYAMLHKKSSSIVKWILVISILELLFWVGIQVLFRDSASAKKVQSFDVDYIMIPMEIISYTIIIYFAYQFYLSYRKISSTDTVKNLMSNILKTRKIVSTYIYINIAYFAISCIVALVVYFNFDPDLISTQEEFIANGDGAVFYFMYIVFMIVGLSVLLLLFWLCYKVIYGLLLKRLHRNYEELKKIDF